MNKETIFQDALTVTQKRSNKINTDLFNSHKSKSAHSAKINLNALFKVNHFGLNSVLKSALELWETNAFKAYRKKLESQKGITLLKSDFEIGSLKKLFNTIDFVISYDATSKKFEYRNYIYRLKKVKKDAFNECSVISGSIQLFGKEHNLKNEIAYFDKEVGIKEGSRVDYYTLVPKTNFTLWELLNLLEKFKLLQLEKEKESAK